MSMLVHIDSPRSPPVQLVAPAPPGEQTFAEWLDSTNGDAGPSDYWAMDETSGTTMVADIGGVSGTYVNNIELDITDSAAESWVGFNGLEGASPGHVTITTPLQSAAFTAMCLVQFDKVKAKHVVLTMGEGAGIPGHFSIEIIDDGSGGLKPRVWSVDNAGIPVIYVGAALGTIPVGDPLALFYIRRSSGTQEVWTVTPDGTVTQIALSLSSGTEPGGWTAHAAGTWYVGMWPTEVGALDGVMRSLALWGVALPSSDIDALGLINPHIQPVVWAEPVDGGSVATGGSLSNVGILQSTHPEVGITPSITTQGTLGTWGVSGTSLTYTHVSGTGSDTAGRFRITRNSIQSPVAQLTVLVETGGGNPDDLPFFGQYYGGGWSSGRNGEYELEAQPHTWFFYAERSGTINGIQWSWRSQNLGGPSGYSAGDGGTYTIQVVEGDASTKKELSGGDVICSVSGISPGNPAGNQTRFIEYNFSTDGDVVAGQPYCIKAINTHANPAGNHVSINVTRLFAWFDDFNPPNHTEPGGGGAVGSILVASGGIRGNVVGASIARIRGYAPHMIDLGGSSFLQYPVPIGYRTGDPSLRYRRLGGLMASLRYSDGVYTVWGRGSGPTTPFNITGNVQLRQRFRVSRANRTVSGVFILGWVNGTAGNLLVRLEQGPTTDIHAAGNGTLMGTQVSVPATWFLNAGPTLVSNQVTSGSSTGLIELIHYVWVPFSTNQTLTLGQIYNLRLIASGCDFFMWPSARADDSFPPFGRDVNTWATWEATREVSWTAWEDSRGPQTSTDAGGTWSYGLPSTGQMVPITFKCV